MSRENNIYLVVGARNTGKTNYTKDLLANAAFPKKLILDTFDNPVWRSMQTVGNPAGAMDQIPIMPPDKLPLHKSGAYRIFDSDVTKLENLVALHVWNSFVVMEDATRYYEYRLTKKQRAYLYNTKQRNVDIVLIFHLLSSVPRDLVKIANYITLFKTHEEDFDEKKYLHPQFRQVFDAVKKSSSQYENITLRLQ